MIVRHVQDMSGVNLASYKMAIFSEGVKEPEPEADHSYPLSIEFF
jgi:hypothetical protein